MKRYLIIGADGFLGFEVCKQLLDEGYEVIHLSIHDKPFPGEKLLFIGRNSNFHIIKQTDEVDEFGPIHVIIPFYDWSSYSSSEQQHLLKRIKNFFERSTINIRRLIFLVHDTTEINGFFENLQAQVRKKICYPYLYGADMPRKSLFYQALTSENVQRHWNILNITDAVSSTLKLLESDEQGVFIIRNKNTSRWQECLHWITGIHSQVDSTTKVNMKGIVKEVAENKQHAIFPKEIKSFVLKEFQNV